MSLRTVSRPRVTPISLFRQFHAGSTLQNEPLSGIQRDKINDKLQNRKLELKKLLLKKALARQAPEVHPLYMDIATAMRYLRAAEVGRPAQEAAISIITTICSERGTPPLNGSIRFPKPLKETRILVLTNNEEQAAACTARGATLVGGSDLVQQIADRKIELDFDKAFATPDIVPQLGALAKILGPKGLFPNAKKGTVAKDVDALVLESSGSAFFRQKRDSIGTAVGRCSFSDEEIIKNIVAASKAMKHAVSIMVTKKPPIVGQTVITSTHGPGIVIDF